ncbi:hypothetical protein CLU79DRAFT_722238 [Phycomyces nitens]|nr:hypothetical protein CLU79DRAFT_722238 [Phycomyces nitens]
MMDGQWQILTYFVFKEVQVFPSSLCFQIPHIHILLITAPHHILKIIMKKPSDNSVAYKGARSETLPEQVNSSPTELIIKHYNPNGLPVVLNEDLEPMNPMEYTCLVCSQRFSSRYNYNRHMETH